MKRRLSFLIMFLFFSTCLIGCKSDPSSGNNLEDTSSTASSGIQEGSKDTSSLTVEKIREKYSKDNLGKILNIYDYHNYILVEYVIEGGQQRFDLYNLKTGDRDIMPLDSQAKVFNFSSSDYIVFESDGICPLNGHKYFPYYMTCCREKEVTGSEYDFYMKRSDLYKPIRDGIEFGVKSGEMASDLKVTLTGFEIQFIPQKGKEADFYTAYTTIPVMKTSYIENKNQFIVELVDTTISPELLGETFKEQNRYISSVQIRQKGSNSQVIITLKDIAKFYNAIFGHAENDDFPSIRFVFRNSDNN